MSKKISKISRQIAEEIRKEYKLNPAATYEYLSEKYDTTTNAVCRILLNIAHYDPNYQKPDKKSGGVKRAIFIPKHIQEMMSSTNSTTSHRARGHNHVINKFS